MALGILPIESYSYSSGRLTHLPYLLDGPLERRLASLRFRWLRSALLDSGWLLLFFLVFSFVLAFAGFLWFSFCFVFCFLFLCAVVSLWLLGFLALWNPGASVF